MDLCLNLEFKRKKRHKYITYHKCDNNFTCVPALHLKFPQLTTIAKQKLIAGFEKVCHPHASFDSLQNIAINLFTYKLFILREILRKIGLKNMGVVGWCEGAG